MIRLNIRLSGVFILAGCLSCAPSGTEEDAEADMAYSPTRTPSFEEDEVSPEIVSESPFPTQTPEWTSPPEVTEKTPAPEEEGETSSPPVLELLDEPVDLSVETLLEGHVDFAASMDDFALAAIQDGVLLLFDPETRLWSDSVWSETGIEMEICGDFAFLHAESSALFSCQSGLWVLQEESLSLSPITEMIEPYEMTAIEVDETTAEPSLWMATETTLYLWNAADETLQEMRPGDFPTLDAQLAFGPAWEDHEALWILSEGNLYALWQASDAWWVHSELIDTTLFEIAQDGEGRLWAAGEGFMLRNTDGTWTYAELDGKHPEHVRAGAGKAWLQTDDALFLAASTSLRKVEAAPAGVLIGVDTQGRALVLGENALFRLVEGRPTFFLGLGDGSRLDEPTTILLLPTLEEEVVDIQYSLDESSPAPLDETWSILLDPLVLTEGGHDLRVYVSYGDRETLYESKLVFSVGDYVPPGWLADIEPLYQTSCSACHGPEGGVYRLDSAQAWEDAIDTILELVSNGDMPLPPNEPLTDDEIALIRNWQAGGFLE